MDRIEATIDPANAPSRRVLEKIGMVYERRGWDEAGQPTDYYAMERPRPAGDGR